jgi:HAD superfamily hydrolase (TIGR01549 family)
VSVAILDVDGTLVDTNYHHAIAWFRAFRAFDTPLPLWRIHRHMGMGGDQLVAALAGDEFEAEHGDDVRAEEKERYGELIGEVVPLPCAKELIDALQERGCRVVLASSAKQEEVEHYVGLLDSEGIPFTTSADVEATKPHPDLVYAALDKAGGSAEEAFLIGDSTWDCEAAGRAGVETVVGLLTGGFSRAELTEAGAEVVYTDLREMLSEIDRWAPESVSKQP